MPRNGSGTYLLPTGINPVVTQTLITSNWANTTMSDIASAITGSIARDGQGVPTADIPWGDFRLTNLGDATNLTDAINLRTAQSSKYLRAMSVTGVNDITATLVGGLQVPISGQLLVLTPTADNTGPATLALNGGAAYPITTPGGAQMKAKSLRATVPYFLMFYNGAWVIQSAGSGAAFAQGAISGWDRPASGTFPAVTIANTSQVSVPSGTGRIVAPGASNFTDAIEVVWSSATVSITSLATAFCTTIGVDVTGAVTQIAGIAPPEWARDNIVLCTVAHPRGQVIGIEMSPTIYGDMAYASYDLASLFRDSVVNGVAPVGNVSSPLHFDLTAGQFFLLGGDRNNPDSPNFLAFAGLQDVSFYPVTGPGTAFDAIQNVPVTMYDANGSGVVAAIPGDPSTAVIHRLYTMSGQYFFLYGQKTYPDVLTAAQSVGADDSTVKVPDKLAKATLLGYIIAQKNTTDLKSSTAILAKGGSIGGSGGGGGGISDAPVDGWMYGRQNASWLKAARLATGAAGTSRYNSAYTDSLLRWSWGANNAAETGANAGSDFVLIRYNDAGTPNGTPLSVSRSDGAINFESRPSFNGNVAWDAGNLPSPAQTGTNVSFGNIVSTGNVTAVNFLDGTGNLRAAITAAASAASTAQTTASAAQTAASTAQTAADNANTNANTRLPKNGGESMTGDLQIAKGVPSIRFSSPSVSRQWRIFANISDTVNDGFYIADFSSGSQDTVAIFRSAGIVFSKSLDVAGSITSGGYINAAGGWGPTSDPALKEVDGPIDDVFGRVMALNTCRGRYIEGYGDGRDKLFIMADDQMAENNPEMLIEGVVEHEGGKYNMYDASQTIALLTAGLQLALAEIESLKRKMK
ncbi:hypothetical protein [Stenotrophomonas phage BUCT555]|nr:hypothetical protein [Stenotrophomonas phage BUCT555]